MHNQYHAEDSTLGDILQDALDQRNVDAGLLLAPGMHFPAVFKTKDGKEAVILGYYQDRYYGFVAGDTDNRVPHVWNDHGQDLDYLGETCTSNWDLVDPK